jgi:hypothetical protein
LALSLALTLRHSSRPHFSLLVFVDSGAGGDDDGGGGESLLRSRH